MANIKLDEGCEYGLGIPLSPATCLEPLAEVYINVLKKDASKRLPDNTTYEIRQKKGEVYWYYDFGYKGTSRHFNPEDKLLGKFES